MVMYILGFIFGCIMIAIAEHIKNNHRFNVRHNIKAKCESGEMPNGYVLQKNAAGEYRCILREEGSVMGGYKISTGIEGYSKKSLIKKAWIDYTKKQIKMEYAKNHHIYRDV